MITKLLFTAYVLILQSDAATKTLEQADETNDLSRLTTILSIALITILILLTISLVKNSKLQDEIKRLKNSDS